MKFTALIQETTVRTIRLTIVDAESKEHARRIVVSRATNKKYREGIVASRRTNVIPLFDTIELLTPATNLRIQQELRA